MYPTGYLNVFWLACLIHFWSDQKWFKLRIYCLITRLIKTVVSKQNFWSDHLDTKHTWPTLSNTQKTHINLMYKSLMISRVTNLSWDTREPTSQNINFHKKPKELFSFVHLRRCVQRPYLPVVLEEEGIFHHLWPWLQFFLQDW